MRTVQTTDLYSTVSLLNKNLVLWLFTNYVSMRKMHHSLIQIQQYIVLLTSLQEEWLPPCSVQWTVLPCICELFHRCRSRANTGRCGDIQNFPMFLYSYSSYFFLNIVPGKWSEYPLHCCNIACMISHLESGHGICYFSIEVLMTLP